MPEATDRYFVDPLNGPAQFAEELREIKRRISELEGAPLIGSDDRVGIAGGRARAIDIELDTDFVTDVPIATSFTDVASVSFTPPAWALTALVLAWSANTITDTTGAPALFINRLRIDGVTGGTMNTEVSATGTDASTSIHGRTLTAPLANPVVVTTQSMVAAGTNADNQYFLTALAVWMR